ncbi:hypothetical protein BGZ99_001663 [Dissophora globulifera]|uniref:Uncharacterized protein n=1 Tax=Dissophora globulifera TaxID=979702 RepID=A0A9P6QYC9_9FUNG|nr:hypothetical protein BGZ99_001663 [Dissophora globulifera]
MTLNTNLLRCGVMAVLNFINTVVTDNPSISSNSSDIATLRENLQFLACDKHGYFGTLVKALYHREDNIKGCGPSFDAAILNTTLPATKRLAYLPMPRFKDNFCVVSEMQLMEAVMRSGCGKAAKDSVVELFGQSTEALEMTLSHSGKLFHRLFFHGKQTNYDRHAGVANHIDRAILHLLDLETLPCQEEL